MKKLLMILLVLGMLLSLAFCISGCTESDRDVTQNDNTNAATENSSTEDGGFGGFIDGSIEMPAV